MLRRAGPVHHHRLDGPGPSLPAPGGLESWVVPVLGLAAGGRDPGGGAAGSRPIPGLGPGGLPGAVPRDMVDFSMVEETVAAGRRSSSWTPWAWTPTCPAR